MDHRPINEDMPAPSYLLPAEVAEPEIILPIQSTGAHESLEIAVERQHVLHNLGDRALSRLLDGNVLTLHRQHLLRVAEELGGTSIAAHEEAVVLARNCLTDRDGDGEVFIPSSQRPPVTAQPPKHTLRDYNSYYFDLVKYLDGLLMAHSRELAERNCCSR